MSFSITDHIRLKTEKEEEFLQKKVENWREIRLHQCPDQSQVHQIRGQATAVHWEHFVAINEEEVSI